ncbi:hypothetical protein [Draconibacterium orientale]|uniref:hypothetical protein n=1 Tax=Draconibacterium orientale TaxID=1168034 RepID=UPI0029BFD9DE|nr:hypothetical protein [Draconibacterium orientale]
MITYKAILEDYKKNSNFKYCFYYDQSNCSKNIKKAHSVQKNRILNQLEAPVNGNNLIYSFNDFEDEDFKTKGLIPIGKKKASIFTGFCDFHDSKLFSPIENFPFQGTSEQLFLFTYRTFAHGLHQLLETYTYYTSKGDFIKFFPRDYLHQHVKLTRFRIEKLLRYKKILNNHIKLKNYDNIKYHYRIIKPFVPIASSSILAPMYTFKNVYLNPREEYSYLVLNIIPDTTQTIICISQFEEDYKGKIFFDELKTLTDTEFEIAISSLLIYCTTNTFFSPLLWDKFSSEEKQLIFSEIDYCIENGDEIDKFFMSKINFFK